MSKPVGDGKGTVREHLEQIGKAEDGPEMPDVLAYLWGYFVDLHNGRQYGMAPCPISIESIYCWRNLNKILLSPWEVKAIREIDSAWLRTRGD
jgi:hypothetical protein